MRIFIIMVTIYTLTDPVTNKIRYVGKTTTDLDKRLRYHIYEINRSKNKHKIYWFKQLINIGLKPIIEVIDIVDDSNWGFWEQYWISQIKTWGFDLINCLEGGNGYTSEDVKKLWENAEYRKKQTARMLGSNNPFYGKKHTEKTKHILRLKCPKRGNKHGHFGKRLTQEEIEKRRLNQPTLVKIIRMDMNNNVIDTWLGLKKMCRELNLDEAAVLRVIKGKNKHHKKFRFKYG